MQQITHTIGYCLAISYTLGSKYLLGLTISDYTTIISGGNTLIKHHSPDHFLACLSKDSPWSHNVGDAK